jgi:hypothetical protein
MVFPNAGIMPKGSTTFALIQNVNPYLHYTLDGSEPTINSPLCKERIEIKKPCTLKVKSISKSTYKNLPSVSREFVEGDYMSGEQTVGNLKSGLKYSYYEGAWDSVPDFSKLKTVKQGFTDDLNLNFAAKKDSFAVKFEGYLHITNKELYDLWITSDDGTKVYLNDQLLFSNDGLHSANIPVVKAIPLTPGYYPLRIEFFEKTGSESITLGWVSGKKKLEAVPIPKEILFYKE